MTVFIDVGTLVFCLIGCFCLGVFVNWIVKAVAGNN